MQANYRFGGVGSLSHTDSYVQCGMQCGSKPRCPKLFPKNTSEDVDGSEQDAALSSSTSVGDISAEVNIYARSVS